MKGENLNHFSKLSENGTWNIWKLSLEVKIMSGMNHLIWNFNRKLENRERKEEGNKVLILPWLHLAGTCQGWLVEWWNNLCPAPEPPSPPPSVSQPLLESWVLVLDLEEELEDHLNHLQQSWELIVQFN